MNYDEIEEKICNFKLYLKQTMDLLNDSYRWKMMAEYCDDDMMRQKYMTVSNTLYELFMSEHEAIGQMFKEK